MNYKVLALFIGVILCLAGSCRADESIYDVVNREDMDTFSDMVVLGYDVDEPDADGYTPLMIAAALGKAKFAEFLILNNAQVNRPSYKGLTALHRAAQAGHNDIVNILYKGGAIVNIPDREGNTPLMLAVSNERRFTVELLVTLGSDVNYMNAKHETPLSIAQKKRFKEIADYLRIHGAK